MILLLAGAFVLASAQEDTESTVEAAASDAASADAEQAEQEQAEAETAEASDAADVEPPPEDEFYQDVDDEDFRPSEDIPADQSIPFPADI